MTKCMSCMQDYEEQKYCPFCGAERNLEAEDVGQIPVETILNRRFIIGDMISFDRLGYTYLAWDALLERKVVIKEWIPYKIADREPGSLQVKADVSEELWETLNQQFLEQARMLHQLQNLPVLVPVYTFFRENNTSYYVMEFLKGQILRENIQRENPLMPDVAKEIMDRVSAALEILHKNGIIHGNLSPENIFLCRTGQIKFLNPAWYSPELESQGYVIFQGRYAPFDYYRSPVRPNQKMDLYGESAVYYRLVTGSPPVSALARIRKAKLPAVSEYGVKVSAQTEKKIMQGLQDAGKKDKGILRFFQALSGVLTVTAVVLGVMIVI